MSSSPSGDDAPTSAPTSEQIQAFYNSDTANSYNDMMPEEIPKVEVDLQYLLSHLQQQQQSSNNNQQSSQDYGSPMILDVCCGTGDMLLWLYDAWQKQQQDCTSFLWKGNDLSEEMLKIAKRKFGSRSINLYNGSMEQIVLKDNNDGSPNLARDNSCAAVLCNFAIHHLQDYQPVVKEMTRLLQPSSGILYLSFWEGHGQVEKENGLSTYYHDPEKVKQALLDLGYTVLQERHVKEEIMPDFSMNAAYLLASFAGTTSSN